jgi:hypothetical protein
VAVRSGNRYAPPLRAAPVTPQPRRWMAVGTANVLELDGAASLEHSFVFMLDGAARVTRAAQQDVDTQARIQNSCWAAAELGVRVWQSGQLESETAVRTVKPARRSMMKPSASRAWSSWIRTCARPSAVSFS